MKLINTYKYVLSRKRRNIPNTFFHIFVLNFQAPKTEILLLVVEFISMMFYLALLKRDQKFDHNHVVSFLR